MKKYYNFDGEFNQENLDNFLSFFNSYKDEHLLIFLTSEGGDNSIMNAFLRVISDEKERITLIGNYQLFSAAFALFFSFNGKRELIKGTIGMWHKVRGEVEVYTNFKPVDKMNYLIMKEGDKEFIEFNKSLALSEDEQRKFDEGEDILFDYERMLSILKAQQ